MTEIPAARLARVRNVPRLWSVVELVGGEGLDYGAAAARLALSIRTVEGYAAEARALAGLPQGPRTACFLLYRAASGNG